MGRIVNLFWSGTLPRATPMREMGVSGTAVWGGLVQTRETKPEVAGARRWLTYSDLAVNTSIVAAGTRYMLNLIAYAKWHVEPADDKSVEAKKIAEFVDNVINDMTTPFRRVARRAAMYRFYGFGIQEWTAKRRDTDGKIGLDDIEARPQHTIERWQVDESGTVQGVWQRSPMGGEWLYLPRSKIVYLVEDSLTDSPEGIGLFRHIVEPWERLKKYYELEGRGFERDLRGTPIGRVPYAAIQAKVQANLLSKEDAMRITQSIEDFVRLQVKSNDTSIVLDSEPYVANTDSGQSISGTPKYGIELLQGGAAGFADVGAAIERTNLEIARIIGVEHLLLGSDAAGGNRALSEDKSQNFYLVVNGSLDEITDAMNNDVVIPICDLNGIKKELYPKLKHSEVSFRTVSQITTSLSQMAMAGAVLAPDDPAIDDVRDLLGLSPHTQIPMGMLMPQPPQGKITATGNVVPAAASVPGKPKPQPPEADTAGGGVRAKPVAQQTDTAKAEHIMLKAESGDFYMLEIEKA